MSAIVTGDNPKRYACMGDSCRKTIAYTDPAARRWWQVPQGRLMCPDCHARTFPRSSEAHRGRNGGSDDAG